MWNNYAQEERYKNDFLIFFFNIFKLKIVYKLEINSVS